MTLTPLFIIIIIVSIIIIILSSLNIINSYFNILGIIGLILGCAGVWFLYWRKDKIETQEMQRNNF